MSRDCPGFVQVLRSASRMKKGYHQLRGSGVSGIYGSRCIYYEQVNFQQNTNKICCIRFVSWERKSRAQLATFGLRLQ